MVSTLHDETATAKLLGLKNPRTLAQWRFHRRYPLCYTRIGGKIFYREEDIQKFIESRTEPGDGSKPRAKPRDPRRGARRGSR